MIDIEIDISISLEGRLLVAHKVLGKGPVSTHPPGCFCMREYRNKKRDILFYLGFRTDYQYPKCNRPTL